MAVAFPSTLGTSDTPVTLVEYFWVGGNGIDIRSKGCVSRPIVASHCRPVLRGSKSSMPCLVCARIQISLWRRRVLLFAVESVEQIPNWNYDGSSTGQAPGHDSEVILKCVLQGRFSA